VLCEFRCWVGVWYLDFSECRECGVVKTSMIEIYIGIPIIYYIFSSLDFHIGG